MTPIIELIPVHLEALAPPSEVVPLSHTGTHWKAVD
jgi:hypothetical protein